MLGWLAPWVAGILLQLQQALLWPGAVYLGLCVAALALVGAWVLGGRHPDQGWRLCGLLSVAVLGFASTGLRAVWMQGDRLAPALEEQALLIEGTVADLPQPAVDGAIVVVAIEQGRRLDATASEATADGLTLPRRVRLFWPQAPANVAAGQQWRWQVRLRAPHGLANPQGFDRELWLWEQGIGATGTVRVGRRDRPPERLGQGWRHPVDRWRGALTQAVRERVADTRAAGVLAALLVGDQAAIARDDWKVFRDTGVAHLMSISGLHITLFAWLAKALVALAWRAATPAWPGLPLRWPTPHVAAWGGLVLAVAYALLAGWGVPAQRTVFMLAGVVLMRWRGLDWPWPVVWLSVLALVLAMDPWAALQAGFWLSFVAVMLLFASDPARVAELPAGAPWPARSARALRGLLREQGVMTLALAPLTLLLFGQVSLVGLAANLLAIPWVTLVVTPLVLIGVVVRPLWELAALAVQGLVAGLLPLAAWPWAVWHGAAAPPVLAVAAVLGGGLVVLPLPGAWRLMGLALAWPALAFVPARPAEGQFELLAPDVGQGSALLVRTARHSLLFDAGPRYRGGGDAGESVLVPWLRRLGERPDGVVVSHRDGDHAGGAESVLAAFPLARYASSYAPGPQDLAARRPGLVAGQAGCDAGQRWAWDGVAFEFLHPAPADHRPGASPNTLSCVLLVGNGPQRVLLTGDIGIDQEVALAARHPGLSVDVLVAPHHGSRSSSSPVWLNQLRPRWVLVQAGHHNRFGHPAPEVTARYEARGARWVASPDCGLAWWRSGAPDAVECWRETHRRYWHATPGQAGPPSAYDGVRDSSE